MKPLWDSFLPGSVGFEKELELLARLAKRRLTRAEQALILEITKAEVGGRNKILYVLEGGHVLNTGEKVLKHYKRLAPRTTGPGTPPGGKEQAHTKQKPLAKGKAAARKRRRSPSPTGAPPPPPLPAAAAAAAGPAGPRRKPFNLAKTLQGLGGSKPQQQPQPQTQQQPQQQPQQQKKKKLKRVSFPPENQLEVICVMDSPDE